MQLKNRVQNCTHIFARDPRTNGRLPSKTHEYGTTQVCHMTVVALEMTLTFKIPRLEEILYFIISIAKPEKIIALELIYFH